MPGLSSKWLWDATNGTGEAMNACTSTMCTSASYQRKPTYDSLGRVSLEKLIVEGTTYSYTPAYDTTDQRLQTLTYPSGFVAKYVYDSYGYLTQIQDNATGNVVWQANTVDAEGHVTAQTAGHGSHTMASTATYDADTGNVLGICATTNAGACDGSAANLGYDWDALGRLKDRSDTYQGYTENFCYDGLNRLTNVAMGSSCTSSGTKTFAYDSTGNMTEKSDVCATAGCMAYGGTGAGPHALTAITGTYNGVTNPAFTYDDNGNMTAGGGRSTAYTSYNMAQAITQGTTGAEFVYGPEHQRTKMCVPNCTSPTSTTYYLYDPATGGVSEKVVTGSTTTWRDYILAPGVGLAAVRTKTGSTVTWLYSISDHLGSVASFVDPTGSTPAIERDSYDAWGRRRNADGTDNAPCSVTSQTTRGYTNQEMLNNLCLVNMNARLYDPTLGRFMSADSLVPDPMSTQSYNKYAYVENSPTNATDPNGNKNCWVSGTKLVCSLPRCQGTYCNPGGGMPCWGCSGSGYDYDMGGYIGNYDWAMGDPVEVIGHWEETGTSDVEYNSDGSMKSETVTVTDTFIADSIQMAPDFATSVTSLTIEPNTDNDRGVCPAGRIASGARFVARQADNVRAAGEYSKFGGMGLTAMGFFDGKPGVMAAGVGWTTFGEALSVGGSGVEGFADSILYYQGDPRPLESFAIQQGLEGFTPPAVPGFDPTEQMADSIAAQSFPNIPACN
jgi:RHS repeat-associated protein